MHDNAEFTTYGATTYARASRPFYVYRASMSDMSSDYLVRHSHPEIAILVCFPALQ